MARPRMDKALPQEDFDRVQMGLPPREEVREAAPDPEMPAFEGVIRLSDVKMDSILGVKSAKHQSQRNRDGVRFMGFAIEIESAQGNRVGWMPERDYLQFRRELFRVGKISTDAMEY